MLVFFWFRTSLSQLECGSGPKCSKHPTETQVKMFKSPNPPSIVHYGPKKNIDLHPQAVLGDVCVDAH
jgi:hypothetical protein